MGENQLETKLIFHYTNDVSENFVSDLIFFNLQFFFELIYTLQNGL